MAAIANAPTPRPDDIFGMRSTGAEGNLPSRGQDLIPGGTIRFKEDFGGLAVIAMLGPIGDARLFVIRSNDTLGESVYGQKLDKAHDFMRTKATNVLVGEHSCDPQKIALDFKSVYRDVQGTISVHARP